MLLGAFAAFSSTIYFLGIPTHCNEGRERTARVYRMQNTKQRRWLWT